MPFFNTYPDTYRPSYHLLSILDRRTLSVNDKKPLRIFSVETVFFLSIPQKKFPGPVLNLTVLGYFVNYATIKGAFLIDLHTHSNASDGSESPSSLIEKAEQRSLAALALTDHDTIGGLPEAAKAAGERGLHFISGIELEIEWNQETEGEFHLLGLGLRKPSADFTAAVEELARRREKRNLEIIDKMNKAGMPVSYDEVKALSGGHSVGRPHFADLLVKSGMVSSRDQAFIQYLGRGKPFYMRKAGLEFDRAVKVIRESGGIAVLAHPMSLYIVWRKLPEFVKNLKERGLDGIEAWHPAAKVSACKRLEALGKRLGLFITAGSDFHGETRPDRKLGITAGGKPIDEAFLEALPDLLWNR
jgi:predicted metal-dependent phosphoesterase TrpH